MQHQRLFIIIFHNYFHNGINKDNGYEAIDDGSSLKKDDVC
jgi:hypothetical protein